MTLAAAPAMQALVSSPMFEEILLRADRASVASGLARGMAHDLRGPLQTLTLIVDPHMDMLGGSEGSRLRGVLGDAVHLLTETVARFGQVYAPADTDPAPVIVDELLASVASLQKYQRGFPPVEVELRQLGGLPPVRGVESHLRHILLSLIANAKQAMAGRPGGRLVLATQTAEGKVRIGVEDEGPGLTPEARQRAFEPFFSTWEGRLGLGLPAARILAERLGGSVSLEEGADGRGGCRAVLALPIWRRGGGA